MSYLNGNRSNLLLWRTGRTPDSGLLEALCAPLHPYPWKLGSSAETTLSALLHTIGSVLVQRRMEGERPRYTDAGRSNHSNQFRCMLWSTKALIEAAKLTVNCCGTLVTLELVTWIPYGLHCSSDSACTISVKLLGKAKLPKGT